MSILEDFKIGETIGEGTFGKVKIATHIITDEKAAIKILDKAKIQKNKDGVRISREINYLKKLVHPNIIQLYSVIETIDKIYLIMEYAEDGELFHHIILNRKLGEAESCRLFQQLVSGVEYLHKNQIAHRDLKPENLLLHKNTLKIVDFGLSNSYSKDEKLKTACGSPSYAAPEMIQGDSYDGLTADIWSCGIVLYAMVCGKLPFDDRNNNRLFEKIIEGKFLMPSFLSSALQNLLMKILRTDPRRRITIEEIKNHSWVRSCNMSLSPGLIIGELPIPVDYELVDQITKLGFNGQCLISEIIQNKHTKGTTCYYLLVRRKKSLRQETISDLSGKAFRRYYQENAAAKPNQMNEVKKPKTNSATRIEKISLLNKRPFSPGNEPNSDKMPKRSANQSSGFKNKEQLEKNNEVICNLIHNTRHYTKVSPYSYLTKTSTSQKRRSSQDSKVAESVINSINSPRTNLNAKSTTESNSSGVHNIINYVANMKSPITETSSVNRKNQPKNPQKFLLGNLAFRDYTTQFRNKSTERKNFRKTENFSPVNLTNISQPATKREKYNYMKSLKVKGFSHSIKTYTHTCASPNGNAEQTISTAYNKIVNYTHTNKGSIDGIPKKPQKAYHHKIPIGNAPFKIKSLKKHFSMKTNGEIGVNSSMIARNSRNRSEIPNDKFSKSTAASKDPDNRTFINGTITEIPKLIDLSMLVYLSLSEIQARISLYLSRSNISYSKINSESRFICSVMKDYKFLTFFIEIKKVHPSDQKLHLMVFSRDEGDSREFKRLSSNLMLLLK